MGDKVKGDIANKSLINMHVLVKNEEAIRFQKTKILNCGHTGAFHAYLKVISFSVDRYKLN